LVLIMLCCWVVVMRLYRGTEAVHHHHSPEQPHQHMLRYGLPANAGGELPANTTAGTPANTTAGTH
jgi:hypothetical protein